MIYSVSYSSPGVSYGPSFVEAESEFEARLKFAGTAFSLNELGLISAREIPSGEIVRALREREQKS